MFLSSICDIFELFREAMPKTCYFHLDKLHLSLGELKKRGQRQHKISNNIRLLAFQHIKFSRLLVLKASYENVEFGFENLSQSANQGLICRSPHKAKILIYVFLTQYIADNAE